MLSYNRGILYSKAICDFLANDEELRDYGIFVHTFCNGRENGFMLSVYDDREHGEEHADMGTLYLWIHEHRNCDACVVRWGTGKDYCVDDNVANNMYSEKIYKEQTTRFDAFNPYEIADFISEKIKAHFRDSSEDIDERWIEKQEKERLTRKQQEELEEMLAAAQDGQE